MDDYESLNSSVFDGCYYNVGGRTLELFFSDGGFYEYYNVPISVFIAFLNASSHGRYFNSHIRNKYWWGGPF